MEWPTSKVSSGPYLRSNTARYLMHDVSGTGFTEVRDDYLREDAPYMHRNTSFSKAYNAANTRVLDLIPRSIPNKNICYSRYPHDAPTQESNKTVNHHMHLLRNEQTTIYPENVWPGNLRSPEELRNVWGPFRPLPALLSDCIVEYGWQEQYFLLKQVFIDTISSSHKNNETPKDRMNIADFSEVLQHYPCIEKAYIRNLFSFIDCQKNKSIEEADFISGMLVSSPKAPHVVSSRIKNSGNQEPVSNTDFLTKTEQNTGLSPSALLRLQFIFLSYDSDKDAVLNTTELARLLNRTLGVLSNEKSCGRLETTFFGKEAMEAPLGETFLKVVKNQSFSQRTGYQGETGRHTSSNTDRRNTKTNINAMVLTDGPNFTDIIAPATKKIGEFMTTSLKKIFGSDSVRNPPTLKLMSECVLASSSSISSVQNELTIEHINQPTIQLETQQDHSHKRIDSVTTSDIDNHPMYPSADPLYTVNNYGSSVSPKSKKSNQLAHTSLKSQSSTSITHSKKKIQLSNHLHSCSTSKNSSLKAIPAEKSSVASVIVPTCSNTLKTESFPSISQQHLPVRPHVVQRSPLSLKRLLSPQIKRSKTKVFQKGLKSLFTGVHIPSFLSRTCSSQTENSLHGAICAQSDRHSDLFCRTTSQPSGEDEFRVEEGAFDIVLTSELFDNSEINAFDVISPRTNNVESRCIKQSETQHNSKMTNDPVHSLGSETIKGPELFECGDVYSCMVQPDLFDTDGHPSYLNPRKFRDEPLHLSSAIVLRRGRQSKTFSSPILPNYRPKKNEVYDSSIKQCGEDIVQDYHLSYCRPVLQYQPSPQTQQHDRLIHTNVNMSREQPLTSQESDNSLVSNSPITNPLSNPLHTTKGVNSPSHSIRPTSNRGRNYRLHSKGTFMSRYHSKSRQPTLRQSISSQNRSLNISHHTGSLYEQHVMLNDDWETTEHLSSLCSQATNNDIQPFKNHRKAHHPTVKHDVIQHDTQSFSQDMNNMNIYHMCKHNQGYHCQDTMSFEQTYHDTGQQIVSNQSLLPNKTHSCIKKTPEKKPILSTLPLYGIQNLRSIGPDVLNYWRRFIVYELAEEIIHTYNILGDHRGLCFSAFVMAVQQNDIPATGLLFRTRTDICHMIKEHLLHDSLYIIQSTEQQGNAFTSPSNRSYVKEDIIQTVSCVTTKESLTGELQQQQQQQQQQHADDDDDDDKQHMITKDHINDSVPHLELINSIDLQKDVITSNPLIHHLNISSDNNHLSLRSNVSKCSSFPSLHTTPSHQLTLQQVDCSSHHATEHHIRINNLSSHPIDTLPCTQSISDIPIKEQTASMLQQTLLSSPIIHSIQDIPCRLSSLHSLSSVFQEPIPLTACIQESSLHTPRHIILPSSQSPLITPPTHGSITPHSFTQRVDPLFSKINHLHQDQLLHLNDVSSLSMQSGFEPLRSSSLSSFLMNSQPSVNINTTLIHKDCYTDSNQQVHGMCPSSLNVYCQSAQPIEMNPSDIRNKVQHTNLTQMITDGKSKRSQCYKDMQLCHHSDVIPSTIDACHNNTDYVIHDFQDVCLPLHNNTHQLNAELLKKNQSIIQQSHQNRLNDDPYSCLFSTQQHDVFKLSSISPIDFLKQLSETHEKNMRLARRVIAGVSTLKIGGWDGPIKQRFSNTKSHSDDESYIDTTSCSQLLSFDLLLELCYAVVDILRTESVGVKVYPPLHVLATVLVERMPLLEDSLFPGPFDEGERPYQLDPILVQFMKGSEEDYKLYNKKQLEKKPSVIILGNCCVTTRHQELIELIALLFAMKLLYPTKFILLRGSYDDFFMSSAFGLMDECCHRFGTCNGQDICRRIFDVFEFLPISSLIETSQTDSTMNVVSSCICLTGDVPSIHSPLLLNNLFLKSYHPIPKPPLPSLLLSFIPTVSFNDSNAANISLATVVQSFSSDHPCALPLLPLYDQINEYLIRHNRQLPQSPSKGDTDHRSLLYGNIHSLVELLWSKEDMMSFNDWMSMGPNNTTKSRHVNQLEDTLILCSNALHLNQQQSTPFFSNEFIHHPRFSDSRREEFLLDMKYHHLIRPILDLHSNKNRYLKLDTLQESSGVHSCYPQTNTGFISRVGMSAYITEYIGLDKEGQSTSYLKIVLQSQL